MPRATRGAPRGKSGADYAPDAKPVWLQPPRWWQGTLPEWAIYWAALRLGYVAGETFFYQSPFAGGRLFAGGIVADFWFPNEQTIVNVQGLYFHYRRGDDRARDAVQKAQMEADGVHVIYIDEDDALRAPIGMLRDALRGIDHSRRGRGMV